MDRPTEDAELLRRYHEEGSEEAFSELVRRRFGLVYQAALRRSGGRAELAQDACQHVFTVLAQNAGRLSRHPALAAWLYTAARYSALGLARDANRRHRREQAAHPLMDADSAAPVETVAVDELLESLRPSDREALILRYLQNRSLAEVAHSLHLKEDAARKRIDRALDKLRIRLARHGAASSLAAAELLLASPTLSAMPAGVASAHFAATALASAKSGEALFPLIQLMTLSKIATGAAIAGLILVTATVISLGWAARAYAQDRQAKDTLAATRAAHADGMTSNLETRRAAARAQQEAARLTRARTGPDPQAQAQAFLRAHPDIRVELTAIYRAIATRRYAAFYRQARLTPAQIEQFESESAAYQVDHLVATQRGLQPGDNAPLPKMDVLAIFGEPAFNQYLSYNRQGPAREFTMEATRAFAADGEPISADAAQRITEAALANSPGYSQGHAFSVDTTDWTAVTGNLPNVLSATQQSAMGGLISRYRYNRILYDGLKKAREDGMLPAQP